MDGVIDLTNEAVDPAKGIPTVGEEGWLAKDVKAEDWTVTLSADALAEIEQLVVSMRDNPLPTILRRPEQFDIPHLQKAYEKARAICDSGVGFAVIDRLPVDDFPIAEMVDVYWTLGHFMGPNVAQKWDGTMIYDVTDTGKKYGYGVRGSATNVELVFHTDNAFGVRVPDYVGLMCKYPAKQGGLSRFCSSIRCIVEWRQNIPKRSNASMNRCILIGRPNMPKVRRRPRLLRFSLGPTVNYGVGRTAHWYAGL